MREGEEEQEEAEKKWTNIKSKRRDLAVEGDEATTQNKEHEMDSHDGLPLSSSLALYLHRPLV